MMDTKRSPLIDFLLPTPAAAKLYAAFFVVFGALNAFSAAVDYQRAGGTRLWEPVLWEYSSLLAIAVLVHPILRLTQARPFTRATWKRRFLEHLGAALLFSALHTLFMVGLRKAAYLAVGDHYAFGDVLNNFSYELSKDVITYYFIVLTCCTYLFWDDLRTQQHRTLSLEREMADLRMSRLREQLRPHFLFNTLNLISSCMYEDVEKADKLMADLCTLLRYSLDKENLSTQPLEQEFRFLRLYLDLVNERFSGRLTVHLDVDPAALSADIPRFLLQPLAENAIEHGFKSRGGRGTISISVAVTGKRLQIRVHDDGAGLTVDPDTAMHHGLGLGNNRATLAQLYGDDHHFAIAPAPEGGTQVTIDLPLHPHTHEDAA